MNLVAVDVRRLPLFREISQSLLTSAATVQGQSTNCSSANSHSEAKAETCLRTPKISSAILRWLAFQRTYEGCCCTFVRGNA
jgi:hypothetical protein